MRRMRVKLKQRPRPADYLNLRFYWLHELRQLRAKRRVSGTASKRDIKVAQKELSRLRRDYV